MHPNDPCLKASNQGAVQGNCPAIGPDFVKPFLRGAIKDTPPLPPLIKAPYQGTKQLVPQKAPSPHTPSSIDTIPSPLTSAPFKNQGKWRRRRIASPLVSKYRYCFLARSVTLPTQVHLHTTQSRPTRLTTPDGMKGAGNRLVSPAKQIAFVEAPSRGGPDVSQRPRLGREFCVRALETAHPKSED